MLANWPGPTKKRMFLNSLCLLNFLSFQAEYFSNQLPGVLDNLHRIEIERSHYLKTVNPWNSLFLLSPTKNQLDLLGARKMYSRWASHHPNHLKVPSGEWSSQCLPFVVDDDFGFLQYEFSWMFHSGLTFCWWHFVFVNYLCFRRATE